MPIGYHGRASTIIASGTGFHRPRGQIKAPNATDPKLLPSAKLDFERELGVLIGAPNDLGTPIPLSDAEAHIFGLTLFNDWSARDIQGWEYQPLGPFLSKSFASTISPWIVSSEALEPFRTAPDRPPGDPIPLPYLRSDANDQRGAFGIQLEVWMQTASMKAAGHQGDCISRSNYAQAAYWTAAQLVTHHTVNGCALQTGDLLGTGTLSGARQEEAGSLMELTQGGGKALVLSNGEVRAFLNDGDTVILKAFCEAAGLPPYRFRGVCGYGASGQVGSRRRLNGYKRLAAAPDPWRPRVLLMQLHDVLLNSAATIVPRHAMFRECGRPARSPSGDHGDAYRLGRRSPGSPGNWPSIDHPGRMSRPPCGHRSRSWDRHQGPACALR